MEFFRKRQFLSMETLVLAVYLCLLATIMTFHEPWFDEAQAWLIARDAGIVELLKTVTHYEGHPPFWFLYLMPLAKSGVPFEFGIKLVNFILMGSAMTLIIFKAPFNRPIRFFAPFTYFFFFQYGVISRPYSLMMLGFILAALFYRERDTKPFRLVLGLAIICGASAYGILITAGIALVWLWEILGRSITLVSIHHAMKLKSFHAVVVLAAYILLLLFLIWPPSDAYGVNLEQANPIVLRLFYMLVMAPGDAACSASYFASTIDIGQDLQITGGVIFGILIQLSILLVTRMYNKLSLFIIPYLLLALFGGTVYFYTHHVGIIAMFYFFVLWCCFADKPKAVKLPKSIQKLCRNPQDQKLLFGLGKLLVIVIISTSLYWSVSASYLDITKNYGTGREMAAFLVDNGLDKLSILSEWQHDIYPTPGYIPTDYNQMRGIPMQAYFDRNMILNLNVGSDRSYLSHRQNTEGTDVKAALSGIFPDVLIGKPPLSEIYGSRLGLEDYALVKAIPGNTIWKDRAYPYFDLIYIRKDLMKNYQQLSEKVLVDVN